MFGVLSKRWSSGNKPELGVSHSERKAEEVGPLL